MQIPGAKQFDSGDLNDVGGVDPKRFQDLPEAKYDSWLTVGETAGQNTVTSVGIDFAKWSEDNGIDVVHGSVFCWDLDKGPTTDRDVVIAQLTVPKDASFFGTVNAQGQTKKGSQKDIWDTRGINFKGGPKIGTKKCKTDKDCTTLNSCTTTLDAKCVVNTKDQDAQGACMCVAKHESPPPPPPPPSPPSPPSREDKDSGSGPTVPPSREDKDSGSGSTFIVVFILLFVGGVGFAYNKGLLPPAVAGALDGVLKKQAAGGAGSDGIYSKTVGDNDL